MHVSASLRWKFCALTVSGVLIPALFGGWGVSTAAFGVITVCAISLWITELLPGTLVAMLLPVAYILAGVGAPAQILAPWTGSMCWLVLGGIVISRMMEKSGVSRRMALWALSRGGSSLRRLFPGIMLAGFLIAPFVPTAMGKAALFVAILGGICKTLNLEPGSREASCIFLCGLLALAEPKFLFFTSSMDSALLINAAARSGMVISWLEYFRANAVPGLLYSLCCLVLLCLFAPKGGRNFHEFVKAEYSRLGPVSADEKKAFLLLGLIALAMAGDSLHGLELGWLMMLAAGLCFLPGVRLLDNRDLRGLPLDMVFFVAGCMTIGAATHAAGVDSILGDMVKNLLNPDHATASLAGAFLSGTGLTMAFTTLPAISALVPALASTGLESGPSGQTLLYAFLFGLDQFLMPYVFAPALYFYASGYINIKFYLTFQFSKLAMTTIFLFVVAIPWWFMIL
ncbi:MAG: anion permease [Desulfovibrionaceae bacterium]|nr:anion permease [Desulfovibrionaceae bacterium]